MARQKNRPEAVKLKCRLSERMHEIRVELYGERGGSEMARRLGLPVRTWYNYEAGVTVPAEILLRFVELTSVEPMWLLHGRGPKFRPDSPAEPATGSVRDLLRTALTRLEQQDRPRPAGDAPPARDPAERAVADGDAVLRRADARPGPAGQADGAPDSAHRAWAQAARDRRCVRVDGDAMAPILSDGAYVAFAAEDERPEALESSLVVAWLDGRPRVRWFERAGRFGVLRAENPAHEPASELIDLDDPDLDRTVRRVLWISTPH